MQVRAAESHAADLISWPSQTRRNTSAKTSSVMSRVWTTERRPLCSASAWKTKAPMSATHPKSHNGFPTR